MPRSQLSGKTLLERAPGVLAQNDLGRFIKPSPRLYPHQWNWDSAFISIGLARSDAPRAKSQVHSLLRGQWHNGMIPHIVYDPQTKGYFPGAERWDTQRTPAAAPIPTSGITQPPMVTIAVCEVLKSSGDVEFVRGVYPSLLRYHRWFHRERDPDSQGLVAILHPWESGLDNSPRLWSRMSSPIRSCVARINAYRTWH